MRRIASKLAVVTGLALMAAFVVSVAPASAAFGIKSLNGLVANSDGTSATQASGHPYSATVSFRLNIDSSGVLPDGQMKDTNVALPAGFIGNPLATPTKCTSEQLVPEGTQPMCPASSQVGVITIYAPAGIDSYFPVGRVGVFNMEAPAGVPGLFGFALSSTPVYLVPQIRSNGDYGITVESRNISQALLIAGVDATFWGVPADPRHDPERQCPGIGQIGGADCPVDGGQQAFLTAPGNCAAGPLETTLTAASWQEPWNLVKASFNTDTNGKPTALSGCEQVPFSPTLDVALDTPKPDSPTGLSVELKVPQDGIKSPVAVAQANVKSVTVDLPAGLSVNPASASGLEACTDAQLGLDKLAPATCPEGSRIGEVEVDTPLLDKPLKGGIFVRTQASSDPSSGDLFRLAIVVDDVERGVRLKLAGQAFVNPDNGHIITRFDNNPQLPFSSLRLHLKAGQRASLATPFACGDYPVKTQITSWSGQVVDGGQTVHVDCTGPVSFNPQFQAGSSSSSAGAYTPFGVGIQRPDGQGYLAGVTVKMPPGITAKLRGVPPCPIAVADADLCPAASRIGSATVGAGAGTPFVLDTGRVYLTEGYDGAPYGLAVAVRAAAGPFDLGTVVSKQRIFIDPQDAHLTIRSDRLPIIVGGVPLRLRTIQVNVDRPKFTINPTSCTRQLISGELESVSGQLAAVSSPFQVRDCAGLGFKPKLAMQLTGKKETTDGGHPGVKATLKARSSDAGVERVAVKLPLSLALDPENANALCEYEDGIKAEPACPRASIIGQATAVTPLLNRKLSGPVYFVKGIRFDKRTGRRIRTLPMLVVALRGEVAINLRGTSATDKDHLVTTFASVPDQPISRFALSLKGGKGGILVVTGGRKLCAGPQVADLEIDAQNGRRADGKVTMKTPCGGKASKAKRAHRR